MSMQLIDTHCHLYSKSFVGDVAETIQRAEKEGVERFYLPAIDSGDLEAMLALEAAYPGKCIAMMGLHPCSVKADYAAELQAGGGVAGSASVCGSGGDRAGFLP